MARIGIATLVTDIDWLSTSLKNRLAGGEVPHLAALQADIEAWLVEVRALDVQQEVSTARMREAIETRRLAEKRGLELRSRAAHQLRGHYGVKAKLLQEFGLRPLTPPRRTPAKTEEPAPPAPSPSPAPTAPPGIQSDASG